MTIPPTDGFDISSASDILLATRLALRKTVEDLGNAHLSSLDAFHHKDRNRSSSETHEDPRSLTKLRDDHVAVRGFYRTSTDFLRPELSYASEGVHISRQAIGTITTAAALQSILRNPRVAYSNLILDDFILEFFRRFRRDTLGPVDLQSPNPFTAGQLIELLSRLLPIIEELPPTPTPQDVVYAACLRTRAAGLVASALQMMTHAPRDPSVRLSWKDLGPALSEISTIMGCLAALGVLNERRDRIQRLQESLAKTNPHQDHYCPAAHALLRLQGRHRTIREIVLELLSSEPPSEALALLHLAWSYVDDLVAENEQQSEAALRCGDSEKYPMTPMEAAGTLNSIQEGLARQLDEIREVCHEIEACHRSPVCPQDADPHDDLHVGRQLREATHLGAWTMSALLAYWLAEDVNHETGVVVRARDVSWSDASTRYSPDAPIDPSIRYRDPGFAAYWALFGLSLARETIDELASAIRRKAPDSILDPNESRNSAIEHALHNSRDLLFEQMARFAAQDQDADAFQLGFHLAAIVRFGSWSLSNEMLRKAFELLFVAQSALGLFDRRHPAWVSAVGEFHCTTFDLLCSLIASFEGQEWLINEYLDKFAMAIRWLEDNSLRNSNPLRSKDRWWGPNVRSGFSVAPPKLVAEIPEARATGVAYSFLHLFDKMLSKDINARVIQKLTGNPLSYGPAKDGAFEKLIGRVDVASQSADFSWLLRSTVCDPLRTKGGITDSFSLTAFAHRTEMIRSAVLFGPPGTGKTTFAEKVAQYLGWPFLSLDPSDFARGGLDLVPERAAEIFRELMELRDTVVLFDEMDELVRRRDGSATPEVDTSWVQRIWTTSLLPKLQRLHGSAHVLFFIATNSFRQMDEAIVRSGRFDFAVWIPVPEFSEKLRWCKIDTPPSRRTRVWADALEEFAQVTVVDKYLSLRYLEPEDRVVAVSPKEWFANVARAEFAAVWDQLVASDPPENQTDRFQTIRDQLKSTVPNKYPDLHAHNRFPPSMVQHLRLAQSREAGPRK